MIVMIDWKRKLTSRKFWAAVAGFVSMLLIYFGKDAGQAEQVAAIIMAAASLIAYMIGEGLADGGAKDVYVTGNTVGNTEAENDEVD